MWDDGLLDEVAALLPRGLRDGRTASRAVGYAQALAELDGAASREQAQDDTARLTRRLARRQESWFGRDPRITWLPYDDPDLLGRALAVVRGGGDAR
jgi:tRNA dimethylallyltransferase